MIFNVGLPRSGTTSLTKMFKRLGYPVLRVNKRSIDVIKHSFDEAGFIVGVPLCLRYEDLMDQYPESKFILNIRDPQEWYDSYSEVMESFKKRGHPALDDMSLVYDLLNEDDPREAYLKYIDGVQKTIPEDRLLVLDFFNDDDIDIWINLIKFIEPTVPHLMQRRILVKG
jgi:hypothetical protein